MGKQENAGLWKCGVRNAKCGMEGARVLVRNKAKLPRRDGASGDAHPTLRNKANFRPRGRPCLCRDATSCVWARRACDAGIDSDTSPPAVRNKANAGSLANVSVKEQGDRWGKPNPTIGVRNKPNLPCREDGGHSPPYKTGEGQQRGRACQTKPNLGGMSNLEKDRFASGQLCETKPNWPAGMGRAETLSLPRETKPNHPAEQMAGTARPTRLRSGVRNKAKLGRVRA